MGAVKQVSTDYGVYKTGRFSSSNQTWYGFVRKGETRMSFISQKEYELGVKQINRPALDELPF